MKKKWWIFCCLIICIGGIAGIGAKQFRYRDITVSNVEEIVIPGLEEEYVFLFLTDLHMGIKTREDVGPYGDADERILAFSNGKGIPSAEQLPQWIDYANHEDVDAVLFGGDIIDYYSDANEQYMVNQIEQLEVPYIFTLGNHELFSPWNEEIEENASVYSLFQNRNTAFQMIEYPEFLICVIDNNEYQVNTESLEGMKEAMKLQKPIILLAHVPFYTENDPQLLEKSVNTWGQALVIGTGEGTRDTTSISREFLDLILSEESSVVAIFTGDNHFYHKGYLNDEVVQYVGAPAYAGDGMIIKVKGNE